MVLSGLKKVQETNNIPCDINKEAFKENCEKIDPDVIVILFYKQIKEKVEEILKKRINGKSFEPILQLSEDNKYYVFAHSGSNLYERFNGSLLNGYEKFIPKRKNGKDFTENEIAVAITYHILEGENKLNDKKRRKFIFDKIVKKYKFELKIKSFNDVFARMLKNKKPSKCYKLLKTHLKENGK